MGWRALGQEERAMHEQTEVLHNMERLFARVCRLRDVVQGNDWDRDMKEAWQDVEYAFKDMQDAIAHLD